MKLKKAKKNKTQFNPVNSPINNVLTNSNMDLKSSENSNLVNNVNNQQQQQLIQPQQQQNQAAVNNQIRAIQYEYWKLYNYYCARFNQYCRAVTGSYQRYINDMIRNTVQQSLQAKMYQNQYNGNANNNNGFGELNSSLSNLLYYKLVDNLVNNNQNQQYQQPVMMPHYPNPAQFANFAPYNNQPVTSNLMIDPNNSANNSANNLSNNSVNNSPNNNANGDLNNNNIDPKVSEESSGLLSPEITNRFKNKLDKILAQQPSK